MMSTSDSFDYKATLSSIISDAYSHIGSLSEGEDLSPYNEAFATRQLELMVKAFAASGYNIWSRSRGEQRLSVGLSEYILDFLDNGRPLKIYNIQWRDSSGNDTPIHLISQKEYMNLPYKGSSGKPTQVYFDSQLDPKLYVWPTPDSSADRLLFTYDHYVQDFDSKTFDIGLPVEWHEALSWNLALRLCGKERITMSERQFVKAMADQSLEAVNSYDNEPESLSFSPDMRFG